jgi:uncharacterized protein YjlB
MAALTNSQRFSLIKLHHSHSHAHLHVTLSVLLRNVQVGVHGRCVAGPSTGQVIPAGDGRLVQVRAGLLHGQQRM